MAKPPRGNDLLTVLRGLSRVGSALVDVRSQEASKAWATSSLRPLILQGSTGLQDTITKALQQPQIFKKDVSKSAAETLARISMVTEGIKAYKSDTVAVAGYTTKSEEAVEYDPMFDPNVKELNIEEIMMHEAMDGHIDQTPGDSEFTGALGGVREATDTLVENVKGTREGISQRLEQFESLLDVAEVEERDITEEHLQALDEELSELKDVAFGHNLKIFKEVEHSKPLKEVVEDIVKEQITVTEINRQATSYSEDGTEQVVQQANISENAEMKDPASDPSLLELSVEEVIMHEALSGHSNQTMGDSSLSSDNQLRNALNHIQDAVENAKEMKEESQKRVEQFAPLLDISNIEEREITEEHLQALDEKLSELHDIAFGHNLKIFKEVEHSKPLEDTIQDIIKEQVAREDNVKAGSCSQETIPDFKEELQSLNEETVLKDHVISAVSHSQERVGWGSDANADLDSSLSQVVKIVNLEESSTSAVHEFDVELHADPQVEVTPSEEISDIGSSVFSTVPTAGVISGNSSVAEVEIHTQVDPKAHFSHTESTIDTASITSSDIPPEILFDRVSEVHVASTAAAPNVEVQSDPKVEQPQVENFSSATNPDPVTGTVDVDLDIHSSRADVTSASSSPKSTTERVAEVEIDPKAESSQTESVTVTSGTLSPDESTVNSVSGTADVEVPVEQEVKAAQLQIDTRTSHSSNVIPDTAVAVQVGIKVEPAEAGIDTDIVPPTVADTSSISDAAATTVDGELKANSNVDPPQTESVTSTSNISSLKLGSSPHVSDATKGTANIESLQTHNVTSTVNTLLHDVSPPTPGGVGVAAVVLGTAAGTTTIGAAAATTGAVIAGVAATATATVATISKHDLDSKVQVDSNASANDSPVLSEPVTAATAAATTAAATRPVSSNDNMPNKQKRKVAPAKPMPKLLGRKPLAKEKPKSTLSDNAQARKVPHSRVGRLMSFGGLAAGLGAGTIAEMTRRTLGLKQESGAGSLLDGSPFLTEANAKRIVDTLCRVRGAALKLGQMLSIQDSAMLNPQIQKIFERVRQSADFMPMWQLERAIESQLGAGWRSKVASFDDKPFAAASIGQVHLANLHDGRSVAMKIQYPGVAQGIESDISNLISSLKVANILPEGLFVDSIVEVAKKELGWECDYIREAECTRRFSELVETYSDYYVPEVISELCTPQIFTSELIAGIPVDKCVDMDQETRNFISEKILHLCLLELFQFGFMQTDPNWSNFFYNTETEQMALLDFGACREYSKDFVDKYIHLIHGAAIKDRDKVLKYSQDLGFLTGYEAKVMEEAHVDAIMILGEAFQEDKPFHFGNQDTTYRIQHLVPVMLSHRMCAPPEESYSLHRKMSGVFLLCSKLDGVVNCHSLFHEVFSSYKFGDLL
ncbi:serine-rich adhesin for platelets-like isoform X2 [Homarus americanus]|uniref:serine-rich adhesin for platelets-like isoform X2 n=1 Tax=Homarus americanus TaxID=6706 RepID=UPI001C4585B4|nr:serine-rich adhesin for platelets-like isoform X2 [Homarus americanus]